MQTAVIHFESPEYHHELELRNRLLRVPLGLDVFREELSVERDQWHYGLFDAETLAGCVVVVPLGGQAAKIRQMAIDTPYQQRGYGRQLMQFVEQQLAEREIHAIELHARLEAEGFYRKLGYERAGGEFVEVGIAHVTMTKQLERKPVR